MKKALGILLIMAFVGICANVAAADVPSMDDPGEIYCNDVVPTFILGWHPNSKIKMIEFYEPSGTGGYNISHCNFVYNTDSSGVYRFQPFDVIPGSGTGHIQVCGLISGEGEDAVWSETAEYPFTVKTESFAVPSFTIPERLDRGQELVLTMPDNDKSLTYSIRLQGRDTGKYFSQSYDAALWKAGETHTVPGEFFQDEDVYSLYFYVEKPRCDDARTDTYTIVVGNADPRDPIKVMITSIAVARHGLNLLQNHGIIQLQSPLPSNIDTAIDTAEKPSRLRLNVFDISYPSRLSLYFDSGSVPDYFIAGASEVADYIGWYPGLRLLMQESEEDAVNADRRVGLYAMNHTLEEFYTELDLTVPLEPVDIHLLGKVTFITPDDLVVVDEEAFRGIAAEVVQLTDQVQAIGSHAFSDSALKQIIIPDSVTDIAEDAFEGCDEFVVFCSEGSYAQQWVLNHRNSVPVKYGLIDQQ